MVDYTNPLMRDESYRRWKGGQKLADELRAFYTSPAALKRIAANNPMGPSQPAGGRNVMKMGIAHAVRRAQRRAAGSGRGGSPHQLMFLQKLSKASAEEEKSPTSQSGATL